MKVIQLHYPQSIDLKGYCACIGNFDGVHIGHQKLLETASQSGYLPAVITFDPHPEEILRPDEEHLYLTSQEAKMAWLRKYGVETVVVISFTEAFARLSKEEFLEYLNSFGLSMLVCGYNFHFGCQGKGNVDYLLNSENAEFEIVVCNPVMINETVVSSTRIKQYIRDNEMAEAVEMLGHEYTVEIEAAGGEIVKIHNVAPEDGLDINVSELTDGTYEIVFN